MGLCRGTQPLVLKAELHIRKFLENSRERWMRICEQVMYRSVYSYVLAIRHYAPNTFSALPNLPNQRMLVKTIIYVKVSSYDYSSIYVRMPENVDKWYSPILRKLTYVRFHLNMKRLCQRVENNGFYYSIQCSPTTPSGTNANRRS